jgi:hypothetical protein
MLLKTGMFYNGPFSYDMKDGNSPAIKRLDAAQNWRILHGAMQL